MSASVSDARNIKIKDEVTSIRLAYRKIHETLCAYITPLPLNATPHESALSSLTASFINGVRRPLQHCVQHVENFGAYRARDLESDRFLKLCCRAVGKAKDAYATLVNAVNVSVEDDLEIVQRFEIIEDALKNLEKLA